MIGKISKQTIERLPLNSVMWDQSLSGFGARRQRKHVHYLLRYRLHGKQRFHSIGKHGMWTPETARNEARRLLGLVASKIDPASEKVRPADTFIAEVERYLERKRPTLRPRSMVEVERHLLHQSRPLHDLPLAGIDRRAIALCLAEVEQHSGPIARNRVRSSLSAFFSFAIREGLLDGANPTSGTGKAAEGNGRDRVLSTDELAAILGALGDDPFSEIIRLLILSGQRRSEIGSLKWSEIDLERGLIIFPPDRCKNGRQHELPISNQARAILERQPKQNEWVFGAEFRSWARAKTALDQRLNGIAPWTIHDCRRAVATHLAEMGTQPHHIEAILNHYSGHRAGVHGVYNRSRYETAMREALQMWGDHVDTLSRV
jgi:integrase